MQERVQLPEITRISGITFLSFAARGLVIPMLALYLAAQGFSGTEIGTLLSLSALIQLVITPSLNMYADRSGQHRRLYYVLVTGVVLATAALVIPGGKPWIIAAVLLRDLSDPSSITLMTQLTLTWIDRGGKAIYGRIRAWGSLGWAITSFTIGTLFALGGYIYLFVAAAFLNLLQLPLIRALPERTADKPDKSVVPPQQREGQKTRFNLLRLFRLFSEPVGRRLLPLFCVLFLYYIGFNANIGFLTLYLERDLGASKALIGQIVGLSALAEIPVMYWIHTVINRFGERTTFVMGILGMAGLWFSMTLLTDTTLLLPLLLTRGGFFTLFSVSLILLIKQVSPPENAATHQALAQVTIPALAALCAGTLNGHIFDVYGGRTLLRLATVMALLAIALFLFTQRRSTSTVPVTETSEVQAVSSV